MLWLFFFFKQKTAYEMSISDWSSDVCSSDLPTHLPGMLTRREIVDYYCGKMNLTPNNWAFYEVYGLFRLAAIIQQIYFRYHHKQTRNPAFKRFWLLANYLIWRSRKLIKQSERDRQSVV